MRTPGAPFIICRAGFKVSAVGCEAPDTYPSASPNLTIIVAKYLEFVFKISSAFSNVIPLFFRNSYNSCVYWFNFSDLTGLIISIPSRLTLFSDANFFISSSFPSKIIFANFSLITISAPLRVLISSLSGNTIVLMLFLALSFILSINPIIIFPFLCSI